MAEVGAACAEYQNVNIRNLPCRTIQCDEKGKSLGRAVHLAWINLGYAKKEGGA